MWTKVHVALRRRKRPLLVANALAGLSIPCFVPNILAVKVVVKLRNRRKVVYGAPICRGRISQILDTRSGITLTSDHVADFG